MAVDRTLGELRRELRALGVPTEERDVFWMRPGDPMLSVAPGLVVWVGPEWFRWLGEWCRWHHHPATDPAGAARLIHRVCLPPPPESPEADAAPR